MKPARANRDDSPDAEMQTLLVDDLITLSQVVLGSLSLHVEPVVLRSLIPSTIDTLRPIAAAKGVQIECKMEAEHDECSVDPKRLHQVLGNLLSNAVKFTPAGGRVSVLLTEQPGWLKIQAKDTGVGIRAESLPNVFNRFWQDKRVAGTESGLGLGLSIVRQLVEMHGGTVSAESSGEGLGATLSILLPQMPGTARPDNPTAQ